MFLADSREGGTGGGGLVELRGLSLHCLSRGESNTSLLDQREAGGPASSETGY